MRWMQYSCSMVRAQRSAPRTQARSVAVTMMACVAICARKDISRRESRRTVDDEIIKSGLLCLLCELVHAALAQSGQSDRRGQQVQRLVHGMTRHGVRELHHAARHVGKRVDHPIRHAQYDIQIPKAAVARR